MGVPETGDIYYLNGNVGIGTNNPEYLLDISGDINLTGNIFQNGILFSGGGGGGSGIVYGSTDGEVQFSSSGGQGGKSFRVQIIVPNDNGNSAIEFGDNGDSVSWLMGANDPALAGGSLFQIKHSGTAGTPQTWSKSWVTEGSTYFSINESGNVGIGTTNPSAPLSICGSNTSGNTSQVVGIHMGVHDGQYSYGYGIK